MNIQTIRKFTITLKILLMAISMIMTGTFVLAGENAQKYNFIEIKPKHSLRIFLITLRNLTVQDAKILIDKAHAARFNAIMVNISDAVALRSAPWSLFPKGWDRETFINFVKYVKEKELEFIPYVQFLTHQEMFFQNRHPELMFNRLTYDPRKEEVYTFVFNVLDELIELTQPKAINIGHDEVIGWNVDEAKKLLAPGEQMLSADLFYMDVMRIYQYLRKRKIDVWMCGDMLISTDEFPTMLAVHLHGGKPGYGRTLRQKIPKDIVICDWHYFDKQEEFPTIDTFRREGFRVIGVTWKPNATTRNFSKYAATHGAYGMTAAPFFHVQRYEWDIVDEIIKASSEAFWNGK